MSHQFEKGKAPKGGRPKGAKNKVGSDIKEKLAKVVDYYLKSDKFELDLNNLEPLDRLNVIVKALPYLTPKQTEKTIDITSTKEELRTWVIKQAEPKHVIELREKELLIETITKEDGNK